MEELELSLLELEQYANEYFDKMIEKDPKFIDNCSDSWIYDAENWFFDKFDGKVKYISMYDFLNMCKANWKRHYDELHAYDDYSNIITYGSVFNKVVDLQRDLLPAQKYLCHAPWASHLTEEQAQKRLEKFKSINNTLADILKTLGTLSKELRLENPVETICEAADDAKFI